jgi:hypothetical protein
MLFVVGILSRLGRCAISALGLNCRSSTPWSGVDSRQGSVYLADVEHFLWPFSFHHSPSYHSDLYKPRHCDYLTRPDSTASTQRNIATRTKSAPPHLHTPTQPRPWSRERPMAAARRPPTSIWTATPSLHRQHLRRPGMAASMRS